MLSGRAFEPAGTKPFSEPTGDGANGDWFAGVLADVEFEVSRRPSRESCESEPGASSSLFFPPAAAFGRGRRAAQVARAFAPLRSLRSSLAFRVARAFAKRSCDARGFGVLDPEALAEPKLERRVSGIVCEEDTRGRCGGLVARVSGPRDGGPGGEELEKLIAGSSLSGDEFFGVDALRRCFVEAMNSDERPSNEPCVEPGDVAGDAGCT
jgi:hypothetical protein